jgi:hypothetical protein
MKKEAVVGYSEILSIRLPEGTLEDEEKSLSD